MLLLFAMFLSEWQQRTSLFYISSYRLLAKHSPSGNDGIALVESRTTEALDRGAQSELGPNINTFTIMTVVKS